MSRAEKLFLAAWDDFCAWPMPLTRSMLKVRWFEIQLDRSEQAKQARAT